MHGANGGNRDLGPGTRKAEDKGGNREPATGNRGGIRTTSAKALRRKQGPGTGKATKTGGNRGAATGNRRWNTDHVHGGITAERTASLAAQLVAESPWRPGRVFLGAAKDNSNGGNREGATGNRGGTRITSMMP